jgi:peptidoglycan/xylan/chitin deacetylase (PgdA/CDA1 family)
MTMRLTRWKTRAIQASSVAFARLGGLRALRHVSQRWRLKRTGGTLAAPFLARRHSGSLQILTYHRVNDERDPFFPGVPTAVFAAQMEYLARNFTVCNLDDAVDALGRRDVPPNAVAVTFDDGYRDNYVHAFPILRAFGVPATVFLATDVIGSGRMLWHDRVFTAFRQTRKTVLHDGAGRTSYVLTTTADRLAAQLKVLELLRRLEEGERTVWIDRLIEQLDVREPEDGTGLMLAWDEVEAMSRQGVTFGSHTATHPILSRLSVPRQVEEVVRSKEAIERHTGRPVRSFAYPNGRAQDFGPETKDALRAAGYAYAVTTIFGLNGPGDDVFELRRGQPWDWHLPTFALKLSWYRFAHAA